MVTGRKIHKIIASITIVAMLFVNSGGFAFAQSAPEVPSVPLVPTTPEAPTAPTAPEPNEGDIPETPAAPEAPTAPTVEEYLNLTPTPTPQLEPTTAPEQSTSDENSSGDASGTTDSTQNDGSSGSSSDTGAVEKGEGDTGYQSADGEAGDPAITTGDANTSGVILNDVNSNLKTSGAGDGGTSGATVVNSGNGTESDNSGSATIINSDTTIQNNSASVTNDMTQSATSGSNSTSENVGDSSIDTGDANTTGTIINSVNTNVDGIAVNEFNIVDDHVGDLVLDFSGSSCISGCGVGSAGVVNLENGSDSDNDASLDIVNNDLTFQTNDASVENNMILSSNSGDNLADDNTGGDSSIDTGDANVSANVLNLVNNNFAGNVIYTVVNVFGDLIGNIVLPEGYADGCCGSDYVVKNSGNGSDSDNDANLAVANTDEIYQFNNVDLENNVLLSGETGTNKVNDNTGGDSSVDTGDVSLDAQIVNIANNNIVNGDWWLVIVNEAGKWIGKIMGAPDGAAIAGSDGFEITTDENGEIIVANSGNGSGSDNDAGVSIENNNTIVQTNDAKIVNNLDLSANTGGNSASRNTGGNSDIKTGDANIIANITNFVNNNIVGSGRLFVTVVNVFGNWFGDFVTPGYAKESNDDHQSEVLAVGGNSSDTSHNTDSDSSVETNSNDSEGEVSLTIKSRDGSVLGYYSPKGTGDGKVDDGTDEKVAFAQEVSESVEDAKKMINVNLAWFILLIPGYAFVTVARRKGLLSYLPKLIGRWKN